MTDVSNRARVDKGIPAGGQFAAEHRSESTSSASLEVSKGLRGSEDFERVADDFEFHLNQHPIYTDREDEMREHLAHGVLSDETQASLQACLASDPGDDDAIDHLASSVLRDLNRTSSDPSERAFAATEPTPAGAAWTERTIADEREFHAGRLRADMFSEMRPVAGSPEHNVTGADIDAVLNSDDDRIAVPIMSAAASHGRGNLDETERYMGEARQAARDLIIERANLRVANESAQAIIDAESDPMPGSYAASEAIRRGVASRATKDDLRAHGDDAGAERRHIDNLARDYYVSTLSPAIKQDMIERVTMNTPPEMTRTEMERALEAMPLEEASVLHTQSQMTRGLRQDSPRDRTRRDEIASNVRRDALKMTRRRLEGPERMARLDEQKAKWSGLLADGRATGNSTMIGVSLAINEVLDNAERDGFDAEIERWQTIHDESRGTNQTVFGMSRNVLEVLTTVRDGESAV